MESAGMRNRIHILQLLAWRMTPKEAINAEVVAQNKQDILKPLIDWLRAAVTHTAVDDTTTLLVARMLPPTLPILKAKFARKQRAMMERDLPAWNCTNMAPGGGTAQSASTLNQAQAAIIQSLQVLLLQGTVL
jgi:hypothetical protein